MGDIDLSNYVDDIHPNIQMPEATYDLLHSGLPPGRISSQNCTGTRPVIAAV
jgi:hypothetical protein